MLKFEAMKNCLKICLFIFSFSQFLDAEELVIARLQYSGGGDWYVSESTIPNWLKRIKARLAIDVADKELLVDLNSDLLYKAHILYATGHGNISFSEDEANNLRRWLLAGGFFFVNDSYGLDEYFRKSIKVLFPNKELVPLSKDHILYNCLNKLDGLPKIHEHDGEPAQGYAIYDNGRMLIFYAYSSDIGDGLEDKGVHNDPEEIREKANLFIENLTYYRLHPESLL